MCGRAYQTYTEEELEMRYRWQRLKRHPLGFQLGLRPNYNLAPTQLAPVVIHHPDHGIDIDLFRWGLVPNWAKDVKSASKYSLINARAEEIEEKRSYKGPFQRQRAIIPLSGFFEWLRVPDTKSKRPFAIRLKSHAIMSVAGVWEHWESRETQEVVNSFTIITTAANEFMSKIHDRMPVILDSKEEAQWLDPTCQDIAELKELLKPCPSEWLEAYEVSTKVNSPKNNEPTVLDPVVAL